MESWLVGKTVEAAKQQKQQKLHKQHGWLKLWENSYVKYFYTKKGVGFVKYGHLLLWICFIFLLFSMCLDKMQIFPGTTIQTVWTVVSQEHKIHFWVHCRLHYWLFQVAVLKITVSNRDTK